MKKVLTFAAIALVASSMASFAAVNSWHVNWSIGGALDPLDDPNNLTPILQNYDLTWNLLYSTSADGSNALLLGTRVIPEDTDSYKSNSAMEQYVTDSPTFDSLLQYIAGVTTYIIPVSSIANANTDSSYFYQTLEVTDGTDTFTWQSDIVKVAASDAEQPPPPADIGQSAVIGMDSDAQWTKVSAVPEPTTMALLGLGGLAMVLRRRIRR
ncbi:MAG: PEP-CTERM sorting domain-containing protein [Kiritimatiellae bacterium]|nr:PEP-CTERM sorting domain-containing protein [Kiritimatiellia bacterium]